MGDWRPEVEREGGPLYMAIADALQNDVRTGRLKAGDRLPPQRRLAKRLAIDFTTVSRAYAEAKARGLVESHVGRGSFVAPPVGRADRVDPERVSAEDPTMNMPPEPNDPALLAKMREGLDYVGANLVALLRYQSPTGGEKDKIAASSWLSMRGMVPKLERIAVTPGAHATMTAILAAKTAPGDVILCEAVTYPGFRGIARALRLEVEGLAMDEGGIRPDALAEAIERRRPKFLYLNPTLHNPTTATIPTARRLAIAEILNEYRLPAIEDDAYGFIPPKAPAPLAVSAPDLVWHIGGLAKCIGAGLRLAYTVAPSGADAFALTQSLRSLSGMASPISIALATHWIEDGTADSIRRFIRIESAARQRLAAEILAGFRFASDPYAFNLWLQLPEGHGGRAQLMSRLAGRHLRAMPSDAFTVTGPPKEALRLCLGGALTRDELIADLRFLRSTLTVEDWFA